MTLKEKCALIIVALAVIATLAMIPASPRASAAGRVEWSKVSDDGRRLDLSWMGIPAYPRARDGSWIQRNLEARFNLTLKPIFMDWNQFAQRRPMMLCGGDIPDVIWNGDPLGVQANLRNGFIMEIPWQVIVSNAPTYVSLLNRYGRQAWLYSFYQGHNYGIPTFDEGTIRPRIGAWRMDWLRKVGIDHVPETIPQMHEALYRLRYDDPDGDGKKDTYGWSPTIGHWSLAFADVFAAYDVLPFDFMSQDGKVVWGGTLPAAKQALRTLHQWYQEDLLDPDFVLQAQEDDTQARFLAGRVGYIYPIDTWAFYNLSDSTSLYSRLRALQPGAEMAPGPPLRDAAGQRRGRAWGGAAHVIQFGIQVQQQPEKVLRVLRMFEQITRSRQLYLEARCGKEGLQWRNDPQRGIVALAPYDQDDHLRDQEMINESGFGSLFFYPASLDDTYHGPYTDPRAAAFDQNYRRPQWAMINVLGKCDVVPSASRYLEDLRNYQLTVFVEMVTGRRSVDDFDNFVHQFQRRGGDVIVSEANEIHAQLQQIYARVGATATETQTDPAEGNR